jgi:serine/threonine-protein kinase
VQTFDHGLTDDGQPYIVMELLEGESLGQRCKRDGPLPLPLILAVVTQTAKALARAHERGIYHRDVKPENIFLVDSGDDMFVKVLDFGVAKFVGAEAINMTTTGNMVGTPAYMSPEQLFGTGKRDHRCDLWSLAVVAYYMLIGERPFDGITIGELCASIRRCEFEPPSRYRNDVPTTLDAWFTTAFARDLADRFPTAKLFAQSFEQASGAGDASVMSSTPSGVFPRPIGATLRGTSSSHAGPAAASRGKHLAVAAAAACIVFGGIVAIYSGRADPASSSGATAAELPAGAAGRLTAKPVATLPAVMSSDVAAPGTPSSGATSAASDSASASESAGTQAAPKRTWLRPWPGRSTTRPRVQPPIRTLPSAAPAASAKAQEPADERARRAAEELGI